MRVGTYAPSANFFFVLSFLIDFIRVCRQFDSYSRKTIENRQFSVQIKIFPKNTFLPFQLKDYGFTESGGCKTE